MMGDSNFCCHNHCFKFWQMGLVTYGGLAKNNPNPKTDDATIDIIKKD